MEFDLDLGLKQQEAVDYMLRPESDGAALLAFDVGLGKTRTGLMLVRSFKSHVVLVCAPLQTLEDWEKTALTEFPEIPVFTISSSAQGKKALSQFQWRQHGLYLVTPEYFERLAWVKVPKKKRRASEPDKLVKVDSGCWGGPNYALIYDESHRSANVDSSTHKALMNIHPDVFKLSMSGTFMGDKFEGAYGATRWLWPHRTDIIPTNLFAWRKLWAETEYNHFAAGKEKVIGETNPGAFVSALPCYIREEATIPPPIVHDIWVELYPEQRRVYDELDSKMVAWILDEPLSAEYSIVKRARQRTTTLAMPTLVFEDNEETGENELVAVEFSHDAESAKIDALFREIDGEGELKDLMVDEALVILTDSQKFARLLTARMNETYGDVAREWSGKVSKPRRKKVKADFIAGNIRFLVGVQAAMGTGTDGLQHASNIVVQMSLADRRINNEQGIGRLARMGQKKQVHVVNFLGIDTVDGGQQSAQMTAALAIQKAQRAKHKREVKDREREIRAAIMRGETI